LERLLDGQVLVAFISSVIGPLALLFASNKKSREKAAEAANGKVKDPAAFLALMEWADRQMEKTKEREADFDAIEKRVAELERLVFSLKHHNQILASQIIQLGGQPFELVDFP